MTNNNWFVCILWHNMLL